MGCRPAGLRLSTMGIRQSALRDAQSASVQELHDQVVRRRQLGKDGFHLLARQHHRNIRASFHAYHAVHLAKFLPQSMAEEEQQRIEGLVAASARSSLPGAHFDLRSATKSFNESPACGRTALVLRTPLPLRGSVNSSADYMSEHNPPKWCCTSFESLYDFRTGKGLHVFASDPIEGGDGTPSFHITFRCTEKRNLPKLLSVLKEQELPCAFSPNVRTGMKFCPWCGKNLKKFYRKNYSQLVRHCGGLRSGRRSRRLCCTAPGILLPRRHRYSRTSENRHRCGRRR